MRSDMSIRGLLFQWAHPSLTINVPTLYLDTDEQILLSAYRTHLLLLPNCIVSRIFFESHTIPVLICCITISKLGKVNIVFLFICFWSRWNPCEFENRSWRGVLDTTLWNKVCQWLATDRWFSPGTPVSSTNKFDSHDIIQLSPLLECDQTVCLPEKSKVTRRVTLQQGW